MLGIANQCPSVFGFHNISASVIELYLVGSEVPYIKCASLLLTDKQTKFGHTACVCVCVCYVSARMCECRRESETDRCVCSLSSCSDSMVVSLEEGHRSILIDDSPL